MTTGRRKFRFLSNLWHGFGTLAARALGLGGACFGLRGLAMSGLAPCGLPAPDLALTFRVLAVSLVPAPRLVLAATPFAHADPRAWSPRSGGMGVL